MANEPKDKRKLTVTTCDVLKKGVSASGVDWTMYEVFAVDEAGAPVEAKLRAFDPLPINELVEYGVTKRVDNRHGTSYTLDLPKALKPKRDKPKDFKAQLEELRLSHANLEQRFAWVVDELHKLQVESGAEPTSPPDAPATSGPQSGPTSAGAPTSPGATSGALASDNDIPF